jgi:hypothetical protein
MLEILEKINKQALEEIEKYQRLVRKKNIKAKKKLIGRGNAGAKSGLGPMEEVQISERALEEGRAYRKDKEYDPKQLKLGTKVEMEHVKHLKDRKKAQQEAEKTAKDHLDEDPDYYKKLLKYIEK